MEKIGLHKLLNPARGGAFFNYEGRAPDLGYDIDPQCDFPNVIKADFLKQDIAYLRGRLIIGNPPYGRVMSMAKKFFKKSVAIADFVAFILPISQLNNTRSLYEFDLIHSEDLGIQHYTDRDLHCCFNIYQRPESGVLNKMAKLDLEDVSICRERVKDYNDRDYDIRMCYWGHSAGKILEEDEHYAGEYKIKINNPDKKDAIINFLSNFDWRENMNCIAMRKIEIHHIITLLKENIEGIK